MERCFFKVLIKGEEKNILEFLDALQEKHKSFCIGNAAYDVEVTGTADGSLTACGHCLWRAEESFVTYAEKEQKEGVITLWEACDKFHVNMDMYAETYSICYEEHLRYENGKYNCFGHYYTDLGMLMALDPDLDRDEFEAKYGKLTDEEWKTGALRGKFWDENTELDVSAP